MMNNLKTNSYAWRLPVSALCLALMLTGCHGGSGPEKSNGASSGGGGDSGGGHDKPVEPTFRYQVVDDGTPGFQNAEPIIAAEAGLAETAYVGMFSTGPFASVESKVQEGSYQVRRGDINQTVCQGDATENCFQIETGPINRERSLRFRYLLASQPDVRQLNHIAYAGPLFVGSLQKPFAKANDKSLVVGTTFDKARKLSPGTYRILLSVCENGACKGSDVNLVLEASADKSSSSLKIGSVRLAGGAEQTMLRQDAVLQFHKGADNGSNGYYELADQADTTARLLPLQLDETTVGLTLTAPVVPVEGKGVPYGIGMPTNYQSQSGAALWRGWKTDGTPSFARSAIDGETRGVVNHVVYGGATASNKPIVMQGGPLLAALLPDTGELFVGLKEQQTEVIFRGSVEPELRPRDFETPLPD